MRASSPATSRRCASQKPRQKIPIAASTSSDTGAYGFQSLRHWPHQISATDADAIAALVCSRSRGHRIRARRMWQSRRWWKRQIAAVVAVVVVKRRLRLRCHLRNVWNAHVNDCRSRLGVIVLVQVLALAMAVCIRVGIFVRKGGR